MEWDKQIKKEIYWYFTTKVLWPTDSKSLKMRFKYNSTHICVYSGFSFSMKLDWVKFPHSPILHYAFSSWTEETMTKIIHFRWETDLFYNSMGLCGNFTLDCTTVSLDMELWKCITAARQDRIVVWEFAYFFQCVK